MNMHKLLVLLFPLSVAMGQPYFDYMLHPERLSWPLEGEVVHFSSWAHNGSNSDLGHYYGVDTFGNKILCDVQGPGVVTAMWWTQGDQTSDWRWRLYVDNLTTALIDTPLVCPFGLMSPFLPPIADSSSGAYYSYTPIPFQDRVRITYNNVRAIYFHVTVLKLPPGTEVESFTMPPSTDYMAKLDSLAARFAAPATPLYVPYEDQKDYTVTLNPGQSVTACDVEWSGQTRRILLAIQNRTQSVFENFWVRIYTDGYPIPDIEGPICSVFGTPLGWRPYQSIVTGSVGDTLYFNQPVVMQQDLKIEFENRTPSPQTFMSCVELVTAEVGPFRLHGQYREMEPTRLWENYLIGEFDGPGSYVGTVQDMQQTDNHVLEGDEMFFIDGEEIPSWHGTGTEDYFKGGWYWTPQYAQLPLHGCVAYLGDSAAAYRWHNNDPIPFESHIKCEIEVGRFNNFSGHYRTTAFAYVEHPKWRVLDASNDQATHAGESIRVIGKSLDPFSPIFGVSLGDELLELAAGSFLHVNMDSVFDVTFHAPDSLPAGDYSLAVLTDSGYDTLTAAWQHLGGPTLWFQPVRTDIDNSVYAGDTLTIEMHGLLANESATVAIDGMPSPWIGALPSANSLGVLTGRIRVPVGLYEGEYLVTGTPEFSGTTISDSLLHYRYWFRVEPEILRRSTWSGARIKEEWCRDWIRSSNTDPWGRMSCYVLTGADTTSFVHLPFWSPSGGTFQTAYFFGQTSNAAVVAVQINGESSLVASDQYRPTMYASWERSDTLWGATHTLNPGYNILTIRTVGLNPASSGWKAILDQALFIASPPEAAPRVVEGAVIHVEGASVRLYWQPVTNDVLGAPLLPYAYDIFRALPDDSLWYWQAEVSGADTTWTTPISLGDQFEFIVTARRGTNIPATAITRELPWD